MHASGRRKMDGLIPPGAIFSRDGDLIWVVINYRRLHVFICCDERGLGDPSGLAAPAGGWNFQSAMDIISLFINPQRFSDGSFLPVP